MAMEFFRRSLEVERPLNRPMQYAGRLSMLAKENATLGNYREALQLIQEALVHDEKIERNEREERIAVHQQNMGEIYVKMDSLPQAEKCFRHAISVFEKNNRRQPLAESLLDFGHLQMRQRLFSEAIETLKHCITVSKNNSLLRALSEATRLLYEAHRQTGQTAQALSYLEQYHSLNDSIFKETTQTRISEFQVKYETAEKELEILRQQSEINRHKTIRHISVGGLVTAVILMLLLIYLVRIRTRRNRELAETNAMKDKFFSIISHDLKNPVFVQRDTLQILADNVAQLDADTLSDFLCDLHKSADELTDLLKKQNTKTSPLRRLCHH
jgi:tetratricopeptide (TPR) repeat protein